ncbi:DNA topoisomerase 6 subunit B-like [Solanum tuberosum]|uniref:DNA topoisomerase 6 subunit B-like n=1 Tax=Solanum tuberosum TaxID=4113 RepID=UPI00073A25C8|nr:PREDICTED: DNA topoisomerase 6 subunit B-like [Solanum tuberosum]
MEKKKKREIEGYYTERHDEGLAGLSNLYTYLKIAFSKKSPAEFFADNKNIAGFDNPGKCLYTTVRELVENALDSAESISELPVVETTIEEIGRSKFNPMIALGTMNVEMKPYMMILRQKRLLWCVTSQ